MEHFLSHQFTIKDNNNLAKVTLLIEEHEPQDLQELIKKLQAKFDQLKLPKIRLGNDYFVRTQNDIEGQGIAQFCIDYFGIVEVPHDYVLKTEELKNNDDVKYL